VVGRNLCRQAGSVEKVLQVVGGQRMAGRYRHVTVVAGEQEVPELNEPTIPVERWTQVGGLNNGNENKQCPTVAGVFKST